MKKFLATAAFLVAGSVAASAADLPVRGYTKAAPSVAVSPYYDWSGFYIGANAGYGWARDDHADLTTGGGFFTNGPTGPFGGTQRIEPRGAVYGGQAGYNWQAANWVFGLEIAGDGTSIRRTDSSIFFPDDEFLRARIDGIVTVTGRIGYSFNNFLPYIKGGYAAADLSTRNYNITGTVALDHSEWRSGYTIGGGIEYGFTPNWTFGVEYAYMDFGTRDWNGVNSGGGAEHFNEDLRVSTITARLNYKFGLGSGPVVARY